MKKAQARGYLLEIVLSKMIEINGYDVIRNEDDVSRVRDDEIELRNNGWTVRGRGGYHQFDTLGKFKITPPFAYPLRLFVEAKFYDVTPRNRPKKVGIDRVRMGVGILEDVNTNYSTVRMRAEELSIAKYQYNYAIFSTSGFTESAQRLAIAHKIHLIDLSDNVYAPILNLIKDIVEELHNTFPDRNDDIISDQFKRFKKDFSNIIIEGIDTFDDSHYGVRLAELSKQLQIIVDSQYLYLATVNSPYIIPILSNQEFKNELKRNPHQEITITWLENNPTSWIIKLVNNPQIEISFTLPDVLFRYIMSDTTLTGDRAMAVKQRNIAKLVFLAYLDHTGNPTLCTLTLNKAETDRLVDTMS